MATWGDPNTQRRRCADRFVHLLFGEARDLQRRRRRRRAFAWMLALAVGATVFLGLHLTQAPPDQPAPAAVSAITRGPVVSESLPRAGQYSSLANLSGKLIVWGGKEGSIGSEPVAANPQATCNAADVNPKTMALVDLRHGVCLNPALYREHVMVDIGSLRGGPSGNIETVRISTVSRATPSGFSIGPVVLREEQCSSCDLAWTYGDGALWIYAPNVLGANPTTSTLLRVSEQTGRVTQRWTLPSLSRAILATDRDGLWIAPSLFSGEPDHVSASQRREYTSLYRVTAGMRHPQRTFDIGTGGARWMVAAGTSVWIETAVPKTPEVIKLNGPDAQPAFRTHPHVAPICLAAGEGPSAIAGNAASGIYCLGGNDNGSGTVFHFNPQTGSGRALASIPGIGANEFEQPAAIADNTYFFLQPPTFSYSPSPANQATAQDPGVLYRINAR